MKILHVLRQTSGLVAALCIGTSAVAADWEMPTPYPDKTFHTANIIEFADDVRASTNGEVDITVHSAGSLIKHPEIKNSVRSNLVPIGEFFLSRLSNEDAAFGVDSQPFVATSYEEAKKLWDAQKPVVTELLAKQNLLPLFSVPWPPQGLYSKNEISSVEDLKGLKFRAYNATLENFATIAGAAPTQVEAPDIAQAFSTGQVEAMITSPSTGANTKAWDFIDYYSPINAWVPKNIVVVNKKAFDTLAENTKMAILSAAAEAETRGWTMSMEETESKTKELRDNGMNIVEPSDVLMTGLKTIGSDMQDEWNNSASTDAQSIIESFNQ
ncbi:MAG: TRAP transporter substrate-binding protein [Granulosicoccus sp.]